MIWQHWNSFQSPWTLWAWKVLTSSCARVSKCKMLENWTIYICSNAKTKFIILRAIAQTLHGIFIWSNQRNDGEKQPSKASFPEFLWGYVFTISQIGSNKAAVQNLSFLRSLEEIQLSIVISQFEFWCCERNFL